MSLPYSEKVLEYFRNPRNVGEIEDADAVATEGSPACGDVVKLYLKVNPKTHVIEDIKFQSFGCASNIATASIITELVKGKTVEEAKGVTWEQASEALGGLPAVKVHCAVLSVDALRTAIENYEMKQGLVKDKEVTTEAVVTKRLKRVINPLTGLDVLHEGFLHDMKIDNGSIHVRVNLKKSHPFAHITEEEIIERLSPLWDISSVTVEFDEG